MKCITLGPFARLGLVIDDKFIISQFRPLPDHGVVHDGLPCRRTGSAVAQRRSGCVDRSAPHGTPSGGGATWLGSSGCGGGERADGHADAAGELRVLLRVGHVLPEPFHRVLPAARGGERRRLAELLGVAQGHLAQEEDACAVHVGGGRQAGALPAVLPTPDHRRSINLVCSPVFAAALQ